MISDYAPNGEFDTARFASRYLYILAWLSVASMIAELIFSRSLNINFSFLLLFWAASELKRRSRAARSCVIFFGNFILVVCLLALVWAATKGTDGMSVSYGFGKIKNPALWQVAASVGMASLIVGIPVGVLMSKRARRQFESEATTIPQQS